MSIFTPFGQQVENRIFYYNFRAILFIDMKKNFQMRFLKVNRVICSLENWKNQSKNRYYSLNNKPTCSFVIAYKDGYCSIQFAQKNSGRVKLKMFIPEFFYFIKIGKIINL